MARLRKTKRKEKRIAREQAELQAQQSAPDNRIKYSDGRPVNETDNPVPADEQAQREEFYQSVAENPPVNENVISQALNRLQKYKQGKAKLEQRLIQNEDYWKLRQWNYYDNKKDNKISTAWLWNCIVSKHADLMDGYPEANIRPKRADDVEEAEKLKSIIPVIMEENDYENLYSKLCNYILKQGVSCAGVFWDGSKHDGLGDVSIKKIDMLELFWEPGVDDIQDSKDVFHVKYEDNDRLIQMYPQLEGKLGGKRTVKAEYHTDDHIDLDNKTTVYDWYYKKTDENGNQVLHYCKFIDGTVLFATENEPKEYSNGWYEHGMYPFIVTALFPVEGTIAGYGYVDIGRGDQEAIDTLTNAIITNAKMSAKPRFFTRSSNSGVNESEFADYDRDFVHVAGSLDETNIRQIQTSGLNSYVINTRDRLIDEMKETLGNRDVNNGGSTSGITAASAIAAMQEQSGKLSRVHNKIMYTTHKKITEMVIELIRQFYDLPREYRITGKMGKDEFINYDNSGLKPQVQPNVLGIEMGLRLPCFDIEVTAQKASPYSKMEQNELAIQLYNLGVFSPQNADMSLALLQIMDFSHKDEIMQLVAQNGTMYQQYQQLQNVAVQLAQLVDSQNGTNYTQGIVEANMIANGQNSADVQAQIDPSSINLSSEQENPYVEKARTQAQNTTQVR